MDRPSIGEVGELALVGRILELLGPGAAICGPGDDAAVVQGEEGPLVLTTDSQLEGVHFRREWIGAEGLGRRAMAVVASDLAAMGASARWALCALWLAADTSLAWVEALVRGLRAGAEACGCAVVGGDVARVPTGLGLSVSLVGRLASGVAPVRRQGARPGDGCWVTGYPGRAAAGRALLEAGYRVGEGGREVRRPAGEGWDDPGALDHARACLEAYLEPRPPLGLGPALAAGGLVHAMIDVSDGVARDALRVCDASGVGLLLDGGTLGLDAALLYWERAGLGDALRWALAGGEDYQLLCAVPPETEGRVAALAEEAGVAARRIGQFLLPSEGRVLQLAGSQRPLEAWGWDHFAPGAGGGAAGG